MSSGGSNTCSNSTSSKSLKRASDDIAWEWGECRVSTNKNLIWCKFCKTQISSGISRFKEHLAHKKGNVRSCPDVPNDVRMKCAKALQSVKKKKIEKARVAQILENDILLGGEDDLQEKQPLCGDGGSGGGRSHIPIRGSQMMKVASNVKGPLDTMLMRDMTKFKQATLDKNNPHKEKLQNLAWVAIADWAYEVGLSFNAVRTPKFQNMIHAIGDYGRGMPAPSYHNMRVTLLRDMLEETKLFVRSLRKYWENYGCSIMSDFWTDGKSRCLINFLVNCPQGTVFLKSIDASEYVKDSALIVEMINEVIADVGEANIVQFVTDNGSNFKAAGKELERQHPKIFWTPCAAHCINLILQDLGHKLPKIHKVLSEARSVVVYIYNHGRVLNMLRKLAGNKELHRSCVTRFATFYYTLQSIWDNRCNLQVLFVSAQWRNSSFSTKPVGKKIENIVARNDFWDNVEFACKILAPLVEVLRLVDAEEKPCMGYIYEAMDRGKERIKTNLGANDNDRVLGLVWKIIDDRWNDQRHHPLHAAGFYLNPSIYYKHQFYEIETNKEIKGGLNACIDKLCDEDENDRIRIELRAYRDSQGQFANPSAVHQRDRIPPVEWWINYGFETPILQKFAIKVLSLTSSASPCEHNWSSFDHLHSKKRNRLLQSKLNDLVFIQYNKKLERRMKERNANINSSAHDPIVLRDIDENDDWLIPTDNELQDFVREGNDLTWSQVRDALRATDPRPNTSMARQSNVNTSYSLHDEEDQEDVEEDADIEVD